MKTDEQKQMQALNTADYRGYQWPQSQDEEDEGYPLWVSNDIRLLHSCLTCLS